MRAVVEVFNRGYVQERDESPLVGVRRRDEETAPHHDNQVRIVKFVRVATALTGFGAARTVPEPELLESQLRSYFDYRKSRGVVPTEHRKRGHQPTLYL